MRADFWVRRCVTRRPGVVVKESGINGPTGSVDQFGKAIHEETR
jgi:hypothetical protein